MPTLHLQITKPKQITKISNHIVAQNFRLTKATVLARDSGTATQGLIGNLEIHIDGLRGNEILSNKTAGRIPIPVIKHYNVDQLTTTQFDYDLNFTSESLSTTFTIETFGYFASTGKTSIQNLDEGNIQRIPAGTDGFFLDGVNQGFPIAIDLYFDYETNHTFF